MYAQFFGSFLVQQHAVTPDQLADAIARLGQARIKLGTMAMHKGYMDAGRVDEVCMEQTRQDKRFGEIAVEMGYLTQEQVSDLLQSQTPDYLLLGQNLVDTNALTNADLERFLASYQQKAQITDLNVENEDQIRNLVKSFFLLAERPVDDAALMYMTLLFNDLVRFIGSDFTPLPPSAAQEIPVHHCLSQVVTGPVRLISRIEMEEDAAIRFASRFAKMEFDGMSEYITAAAADFLNLHNGLFSVNMSNEYGRELNLEPPVEAKVQSLALDGSTCLLPVQYPFGTVNFILSL